MLCRICCILSRALFGRANPGSGGSHPSSPLSPPWLQAEDAEPTCEYCGNPLRPFPFCEDTPLSEDQADVSRREGPAGFAVRGPCSRLCSLPSRDSAASAAESSMSSSPRRRRGSRTPAAFPELLATRNHSALKPACCCQRSKRTAGTGRAGDQGCAMNNREL